jgi:hypothetical protein
MSCSGVMPPFSSRRALRAIKAARRPPYRLLSSEREEPGDGDDAHHHHQQGEGHADAHEVHELVVAGPSTRVLTGDETGVMKAAEAAMAMVMAKG